VVPLEKEAATRSDAPSDFAPTLLNRPAERRPFSRQWPIFAASLLILAVLAAILILLPSNVPPSALPSEPPHLAETSETPATLTPPPVETPRSVAPPLPTDSLSPVTCKASALVGAWRFDTHILHGDHAGKGVRDHYTAYLRPLTAETLGAELVKKGDPQGGVVPGSRLRSNDPLSLSPSSCSAAAHLRFTRDASSIANEVRFRMARVGDRLIGLWRHEGSEWTRAHHSGALVGSRANDELPERPDCFLDCVRKCHPGLDPLDAATEKCLLGCAPELERCSADTRR
jgi:hypothetical protein